MDLRPLELSHHLHNALRMDNFFIIKPIYKSSKMNLVLNYCAILIGFVMVKLFDTIMQNKLSILFKESSKRVRSQFGFHKHHNTTNQLVSRRVVMEESQLKGEGLYFYFFLTLKEHSTQYHDKIYGKEWKN